MAISRTFIRAGNFDPAVKKALEDFSDILDAQSGTLTAAELGVLDGVTAGTAAASKALVLDANKGISGFRQTALNLQTQGAPAAKTTSTTLTAAELLGRLITGAQGAAGAATYTLPLGTDIETALLALYPGLQTNDSFDFSVINISTVAAEDVTIAGNTGTTLVGTGVVNSNDAGTSISTGTFRVRRTAANTYSVYRIS